MILCEDFLESLRTKKYYIYIRTDLSREYNRSPEMDLHLQG